MVIFHPTSCKIVEIDKPDTTILFVTKNGMGLNASKSDIPVQGRVAGGVKGLNMNKGDELIFVSQIEETKKAGEKDIQIELEKYVQRLAKVESDLIRKLKSMNIEIGDVTLVKNKK